MESVFFHLECCCFLRSLLMIRIRVRLRVRLKVRVKVHMSLGLSEALRAHAAPDSLPKEATSIGAELRSGRRSLLLYLFI